MLPIILLASLPPSPSADAVETLDLGKLSWLDAQRLHGKIVRVSFVVDCSSGATRPSWRRGGSVWSRACCG
jgi:hypothetical protein